MNTFTKYMLTILLLSFSTPIAKALECDEGLANPVKSKDFVSADSKRYKTLFDGLYDEQEKSIQGLQSKMAEGRDARDIYFDTRLGKSTSEKMAKLKRDFGFNASVAHLIDSDDEDFKPTHFQKYITQEQKRFFVRGQKIVARLEGLAPEQESGANSRLYRLDRNCNVIEVTGLRSLDTNAGNAREFVVNAEICEITAATGRFPDADKMGELKGILIEEKFEDIVHRAKDACQVFATPAKNSKSKKSKSSR